MRLTRNHKSISTLLIVLLNFPMQIYCVTPLTVIAPVAGSVTIGSFIYGLFKVNSVKESYDSGNEIDDTYLEEQLATIQRYLKELPYQQASLDVKITLHQMFRKINDAFERAMFHKKKILGGKIEPASRYEDFKNFYEPKIDEAINEIRYLLSDHKQDYLLKSSNSNLEVTINCN